MKINWKPGAYFLAILFAGLLVVKGSIPGWTKLHSDFSNYYVSAKLVADNIPLEHLYNNDWFQSKIIEYGIDTPGKFSPFPPITAFIMLPITVFEPLTAQRIFTVINLIFVAIGVVVLRKLTSWPMITSTLFILGSGLGLINNIAFGQIYLIMTVFILLSFLLVNHNHLLLAGIILGAFTALKYFPIVVTAGFFLNGYMEVHADKMTFRSAITNRDLQVAFYAIISFLILLITQYLYFGESVFNNWIYSSFLPHLDSELRGQGMFSYHFQSWDSFFRHLFVYDPQFNPQPFIDWPAGKSIFKIIITLIVGLATLWTLFKTRSEDSSFRRAVCLSIPSLAALVILPASATYHFILLASSLVLIILIPDLNKYTKGAILFMYVLIGLLPYQLAFNLGEEWSLVFAYPRLWLISTLFILALMGIISGEKIRTS